MSKQDSVPSMQMYTARNMTMALFFVLLPAIDLTAIIHVLAGPAAAYAPILLLPLLITTGGGQYLVGQNGSTSYLTQLTVAIVLSSVYIILYSWETEVVMSVAIAVVFSFIYVLGLILGDTAKWLRDNKLPQLDE